MRQALFLDLGLMAYDQAHRVQVELNSQRRYGTLTQDILLMVEHQPVFTLGRRGGRDNLRIPEALLTERGIQVIQVERGGDITYHGPGQVIVYPIFHLKEARLSVTAMVHSLEAAMLATAGAFGVKGRRDERNRGIWVGPRKLGSLGIAIRRGVTFHGLALNVNLDLEPFSWINPCGLTGVAMTSLAAELGAPLPLAEVRHCLQEELARVFSLHLTEAQRSFVHRELHEYDH
ncbi:MAG: octanoyltransferase [Desulfobulbus propionicus]|nr:MAG: octanoyltransferase [Desulfobulbus propionicus]